MISPVTELFLLFGISLGGSLLLTPATRALGRAFGAMDIPQERKIHKEPIPRIGGLAVALAFGISCFAAVVFFPHARKVYRFSFNELLGYAGGILILCCGLWDDWRRLRPATKLLFQISAASLAFAGGATIQGFYVSGIGVTFNLFVSYIVTVFWFLLFINAINLIDGLDGLAGGLVFFTCLVMAFSTYWSGDYLSAFYFAILGGAVLGFLKYNFNPATIFLGDGGSYFLGYVVAILAIRGSLKSNISVLMVMPLLALGVPIFDAILAPVRRFILGRPMFQPDKGHVHHALLKMGLTSRRAVLMIYGITMALCLLAILIMVARQKSLQGIVLAVLLFSMIFAVRKLGYIEYLALDKFWGWVQDVTDVAGFTQHRRSFLAVQVALGKSQNLDALWENLIEAAKMIKFDRMILLLPGEPLREWTLEPTVSAGKVDEKAFPKGADDDGEKLFRVEIPLRENPDEMFLGKLILVKDLKKGKLENFTIRRVEHLRRSLVVVLSRIKNGR
jgi:UDP-GlcNAc:undecaprenyl-phosphate GlcNAc-1-phosphate transferase